MVDTEEFVQTIIKLPGTVPGASIFPRWLPGAAGGLFRDEYPIAPAVASHEVARERLEAGREELGGLPSLTLLINDSPTARRQAEYLQESARLIGRDVTIKTHEEVAGSRHHRGVLEAADSDGCAVRVDGESRLIGYEQMRSARTRFEWNKQSRATRKSG